MFWWNFYRIRGWLLSTLDAHSTTELFNLLTNFLTLLIWRRWCKTVFANSRISTDIIGDVDIIIKFRSKAVGYNAYTLQVDRVSWLSMIIRWFMSHDWFHKSINHTQPLCIQWPGPVEKKWGTGSDQSLWYPLCQMATTYITTISTLLLVRGRAHIA